MAKTKTLQWDPAEHLETEEDMAMYLNIALEDGDQRLIIATWPRRYCPRPQNNWWGAGGR